MDVFCNAFELGHGVAAYGTWRGEEDIHQAKGGLS